MELDRIQNFILAVILFLKPVPHSFENEFESTQIILFYSPLGDSKAIRGQIVIYWYIEEFTAGDILALYYNTDDRYLFTYHPKEMSGYVKTGVSPTKADHSLESYFLGQCTGYYGVWLQNNTEMKSSCLSTHPNWMKKHESLFAKIPLTKLFIPGTHNSGSYNEELPPTIIQRYTVTQEKSILKQLILGVRYLDLRPCSIDNQYWICHGTFEIQPLRKIIDDLKTFMDRTQEIVIVSFKEFPRGFHKSEDFLDFRDFILRELSEHIHPNSEAYKITLGDMWKSRKRLLLSYQGFFNHQENYLWTRIMQQWGNVQTIPQLEGLITTAENDAKVKSFKGPELWILRAVMAEITLDSSMIIADAASYYFGRGQKSLRELAVETGPLVTMWYNEEHFNTANIVAVDFIDTTGIIEVAIRSNIVRAANFL